MHVHKQKYTKPKEHMNGETQPQQMHPEHHLTQNTIAKFNSKMHFELHRAFSSGTLLRTQGMEFGVILMQRFFLKLGGNEIYIMNVRMYG